MSNLLPRRARRLRRPAIVALTVTAVAAAGATAAVAAVSAPAAPSRPASHAASTPLPAPVTAPAAGAAHDSAVRAQPLLPATTTAGAAVSVVRAPVTRAAAPAAPAAAGAAALPKPPGLVTLVALTGEGGSLVGSSSPNLAVAPDGSRVAYVSGGGLYTSHVEGASAVRLPAPALPASARLAWQPYGYELAVSGLPNGSIRSASSDGYMDDPASVRALRPTLVAWLGGRVVATVPAGAAMRSGYVVYDPEAANPTLTKYQLEVGSHDRIEDVVGSPDGKWVAFRRVLVAADGTETGQELVVAPATATAGGTVRGTTTGSLGRPAWHGKSTTVYVTQTENGSSAVYAYSLDPAGSVVAAEGVAATPYLYWRPQPARAAYGYRVAGTDAVGASVAASADNWYPASKKYPCSRYGAQSAVLVRASTLEAVPAGPLAVSKCGPLLVTSPAALDKRATSELKRVLPKGKTVYLVGSTSVLKPAVATAVSKLGYKVVRYAGRDAYGTAVDVATRGFSNHKEAFLASASAPFDGLIATPIAGSLKVPVLLTQGAKMSATTKAYITKYKVGAWAVGPDAGKAAPWATRIAGSNPTDTSVRLADAFYWPIYAANIVSTSAQPFALCAGAYAGSNDQPLLVSPPTAMTSSLRAYLDRNSASLGVVVAIGRSTNPSGGVLADAVRLGAGQIG